MTGSGGVEEHVSTKTEDAEHAVGLAGEYAV